MAANKYETRDHKGKGGVVETNANSSTKQKWPKEQAQSTSARWRWLDWQLRNCDFTGQQREEVYKASCNDTSVLPAPPTVPGKDWVALDLLLSPSTAQGSH